MLDQLTEIKWLKRKLKREILSNSSADGKKSDDARDDML